MDPSRQDLSAGQQGQAFVIMRQPGGNTPAEINNILPQEHVNISLLSAFIFFPLGLAAIIMSCRVDAALKRGDVAAAHKLSHITKILAYCGIGIGCELLAFVVIYYWRLYFTTN